MSFIHSWKLEVFKSDSHAEAAGVAMTLHARGYKRIGLHDDPIGEQYKTYARIEIIKKKGATKFYFVEFMSPNERWG